MLRKLKELNPGLKINSVDHDSFCRYGRIVREIDMAPLIQRLHQMEMTESGNRYVADDGSFHIQPICQEIQSRIYGEMEIQIGHCIGRTHCLNAMEYHKGNEVNFAATDCLLMLAHLCDVVEDTFSSDKVELFFIPAGTTVELYATTLHFAPCAVAPDGFKVGAILPKRTNDPLSVPCPGDATLFAVNKWMYAHPDSPQAARGAHCGITGENIVLRISE